MLRNAEIFPDTRHVAEPSAGLPRRSSSLSRECPKLPLSIDSGPGPGCSLFDRSLNAAHLPGFPVLFTFLSSCLFRNATTLWCHDVIPLRCRCAVTAWEMPSASRRPTTCTRYSLCQTTSALRRLLGSMGSTARHMRISLVIQPNAIQRPFNPHQD